MNDIETEINTAIKGLTRRVNLKLEHIEIIENALANPDINDDIWNKYLNGNNTKMAFKEKIYSSEMIKLLTLRAIILPDTLPEFLTWFQNIKRDDLLTISKSFHYEILTILTQQIRSECIVKKIELGVVLIIPYLLKDAILTEKVINLLKTEKNLWGYFYLNNISEKIDHDLRLIKSYVQHKILYKSFYIFNDDSWKEIRDELTIAWRVQTNYNRFKPIPKYQVWVRLFDGLNENKFALFFAHFAYDKVPMDIFSQVKKISFGSHYHYKIYDVIITREVGFFEQLILDLNDLLNIEIDMKLWKIIILVIVCGLGGFLLRAYLLTSTIEKSVNSFIQEETKSITDKKELKIEKNKLRENLGKVLIDKNKNANLIASVINCSQLNKECQVNNPANELIQKASEKDNFSKTANSITSLIDELVKNDSNNKQKYIEKLQKILGNDSLDYTALSDGTDAKKWTDDVKNSWVNAIYLYQLKNTNQEIKPDGIIHKGKKTEEILKKQLLEK